MLQGGEGTLGADLPDVTLSSLVAQVQTTLASVQELLRQQQQKVQELAHELAAAKVLWALRSPGQGLFI